MLRGTASKVMWVGRATVFLVGLAVILAVVFGVASTALGANGGNFILGQNNTASLLTKLTGQVPGGAALQVVNTRPEAGSMGLRVSVAQNRPPVVVNATAGKATNLNADKLDGIDSSGLASAYKRTVVVSPVGTDTENGQALLDAMENITDASASKPYLLHIEPATYDLGNGSLNMKPFVDIEGSGEINTVITSVVSSNCTFVGTVNGANNAEMRFLTVRNTGANGCKVAISVDAASLRLTHLTAESTGDGGDVNIGVYTTHSSLTMTDVTATGSREVTSPNYGVFSLRSDLTIKQSNLTGSGGGPSASSNRALMVQSPPVEPTPAKVALTQLEGGVQNISATLQCFNNYNQNMQPVTCP